MKCGGPAADRAHMQYNSVIPPRMLTPSDLDRRGWYRRAAEWATRSRGHRVICMMSGLWLINVFDLVLTLLAYEQGLLDEQNPIARHLLPMGVPVVVTFKVGLVLTGSIIFIRYRHHRLSELTAALMLIIYACVAVRWHLCYELYNLSSGLPVTNSEIEQIETWSAVLPIL